MHQLEGSLKLMFEWDDNKSAINLKKHGISFKEASLIFDYPVLPLKIIVKTMLNCEASL